MERVRDPADPNRCRGAAPSGQCWNRAEPGSNYCRAHGGVSTQEETDMRGFLLAKAEDRARFAQIDSELEPVRQLRETIIMTQMLMEKRWNNMKDDNDLLRDTPALNTLFLTMERLIASAHRIEQNLGALLARNAVIELAKQMVAIVVDELEGIENYELVIDRITTRLIDAVRAPKNAEVSPALPPPTIQQRTV